MLARLQIAADQRSREDQQEIQNTLLSEHPGYAKLEAQRQQLQREQDDINKRAPRVMIMADRPEWRPTYVLNRGLYNDVDRSRSQHTDSRQPAGDADLPAAGQSPGPGSLAAQRRTPHSPRG